MKYRAILSDGAARIEPYEPRTDPTVTGYPTISTAVRALGSYSRPVALPDGSEIIPLTTNFPYATINLTAGQSGRNGASIMKIYFVETNAGNAVYAVEDGKCKLYDAPQGIFGNKIDIEKTDTEGTLQRDEIISDLKKYLSETPLNDFDDIVGESCSWAEVIDNSNAQGSDRTIVTRVY